MARQRAIGSDLSRISVMAETHRVGRAEWRERAACVPPRGASGSGAARDRRSHPDTVASARRSAPAHPDRRRKTARCHRGTGGRGAEPPGLPSGISLPASARSTRRRRSVLDRRQAAHDPGDEGQQWHAFGPAARTVERAQQRLVQQLIPFEARQQAGAQLSQPLEPHQIGRCQRGEGARRPSRSRRRLSRRRYRNASGRTWRTTAICAHQVRIGTAIRKKSLPACRPITRRRRAFQYEASDCRW